jgi:hypothetical protein
MNFSQNRVTATAVTVFCPKKETAMTKQYLKELGALMLVFAVLGFAWGFILEFLK